MLFILTMAGRSQPLFALDSFFPKAMVRIVIATDCVNLKVNKNTVFFAFFFRADLALLAPGRSADVYWPAKKSID